MVNRFLTQHTRNLDTRHTKKLYNIVNPLRLFRVDKLKNLITVCETTHTRHDTEDVVGHGVHEEFAVGGLVLEVGQGQCDVIQAGEVASAGGLVRFGVDGEGVQVDVFGGHAGVVLVGLHEAEVGGVTLGEAIVAVELELALGEGVVGGGHFDGTGQGVFREVVGAVVDVAEFHGVGAGFAGHPDQLLHGVVEVEAVVVVLGGFGTGVLELFDEVLVLRLREAAAFLGVEVDVVDVQAGVGPELDGGGGVARQFGGAAELDVDLHFVVLKGDQGEGEAGVAAEEELKRNVQLVGFGRVRHTGIAATDHFLETVALFFGHGQFGPDFEPFTVMFVDLLATDFEGDVFDQGVTQRVHGLGVFEVVFEVHFQPHVGDQITVAADGACHAVAQFGVTVEGLFDGFHRKVGVTTVHYFEKADLRVTGKEHILCAVGNELH